VPQLGARAGRREHRRQGCATRRNWPRRGLSRRGRSARLWQAVHSKAWLWQPLPPKNLGQQQAGTWVGSTFWQPGSGPQLLSPQQPPVPGLGGLRRNIPVPILNAETCTHPLARAWLRACTMHWNRLMRAPADSVLKRAHSPATLHLPTPCHRASERQLGRAHGWTRSSGRGTPPSPTGPQPQAAAAAPQRPRTRNTSRCTAQPRTATRSRASLSRCPSISATPRVSTGNTPGPLCAAALTRSPRAPLSSGASPQPAPAAPARSQKPRSTHVLLDCPAYAHLRSDPRHACLFQQTQPPPQPTERPRVFTSQQPQTRLASFVHSCSEQHSQPL
jgi:hypothetical protein